MGIQSAAREALCTDSSQAENAPGQQEQERERRLACGPMVDDAAFLASVPTRVPADETGSGIAIGDWNDLFNAVKDRLTRTVSGNCDGLGGSSDLGAAQIRNSVLECVAALNQLQDTVTAEGVRREGLEMAVFEAQTSLAQVRAALVGTRQSERRARYDAAHDHLTRLPNRGFLIERITRQLAASDVGQHRFSVLFLDLDGFKLVNDSHGHSVGDELLRIVAARLSRVLRVRDVVARVGGDEFACLIVGAPDRALLAHLADKMAQSIAAPLAIGRVQLAVHASVGIATYPTDGLDAEALLKSADLAMYAAKRQFAAHAFFSCDDADATPAQQDTHVRPAPLTRS